MSKEQYKYCIAIPLSKKEINVPYYGQGNCDECLKFMFTGFCVSTCLRSKAHNSPVGDQSRLNKLKNLKKEALDNYKANKRPNDPDFE